MSDILDLSFKTGVSNSDKSYQIGFYQKNESGEYIFKTLTDLSDSVTTTSLKNNKNLSKIQDILPSIIDSETRKNSSKNLYLSCLLFIIIGNSSIYYYYEQVNPKEIGIFNFAFKVIYHYIGFLFLVKTLQYVWYTCTTSYYNNTLNGINNSNNSFQDLDLHGHRINYIIDPFTISPINIIPISLIKYDNIISTLSSVITEQDITDAKTILTYESLFPVNANLDNQPDKQYESLKWITFCLSVIIICYIGIHATLKGIPIYGVLYYYNPFACFNMSGFYKLLKSLWKYDDDTCKKMDALDHPKSTITNITTGGATSSDANSSDATTEDTSVKANNSACSQLDHLTNKIINESSKFFKTYNGVEDHLVFDAFKLRSIKVYKNSNILNLFFQFMYIYNCTTTFINPLTAFILWVGIGYIPATPSYFVSGNATIEAMRKSIKLPFYKKWLFYFTQGRCYKSNIMTGVVRRFLTMGLDLWGADTIFNNDKMKLVCNYRKYFKKVGYYSIIILVINIIHITESMFTKPSLYSYIESIIINVIVIAFIGYKWYSPTDTDLTKYSIYKEMEDTDDTKIEEYIKSYKDFTPFDLCKNMFSGLEDTNPEILLYHVELIIGILTIILLCYQTNLSKITKIIFISGIIVLLLILIYVKNQFSFATELNKAIKTTFETNHNNILQSLENLNKEITSKPTPTQDKILANLKKLQQKVELKSNNTIHNSLSTQLNNLSHLIKKQNHINDYNTLITDLESLKKDINSNDHKSHLDKSIRAAKKNKNILSKDHSERENWDIHTNINHKTNLYTTILLNVINDWMTKKNTEKKSSLFKKLISKKMSKITSEIELVQTSESTGDEQQTIEQQKTTQQSDIISFNTPRTTFISDSRNKNTIDRNNNQPNKTSNEPKDIEGQKYSDWTQFFTGGSEYEDKSLLLTRVKCGDWKNNNTNAKTKEEVCKKIDDKSTNKKSPYNSVGIISISSDDFNTLLKNTATLKTDKEICNELYRNKPRCISIAKYYQNVETNGSSKTILELDVTNSCTGESGTEINLENKSFRYQEINNTSSKPISSEPISSTESTSSEQSRHIGGASSNKDIFSNFADKFEEHRNSGKEYYVPVEYLDYHKGIKYKINDILIDPVHSKIKIFGSDIKYDYTDSKIKELVSVYLEEQEVEENASKEASKDEKLKQKLSYDEYVQYLDAKKNNKTLATDIATKHMTGGKSNDDFKSRFRNKFKEVVQDQTIIETFLKENRYKVRPSKYDNIMRMDNRPVVIKTGLKERYITTSGELLPVKPKNPDKDYVDVVTLNNEPMKINVSGKECYMTKEGGLINVRQNKNIYKRKKTFKKKIR